MCTWLSALGLCAVLSTFAFENPPGSHDQILSAARAYANRYISNLPSFICTQTVEQFESDKKARRWRKGDSLTSQLVWDQGREQRTLRLVNNQPLTDKSAWRSPLVSEGEFGNLLDSILGESSKAVFSWQGWDTMGEKHVAVFTYRVSQQDSSMRLTLGSWDAVVPFQGLVFTDADTGTVWRITNETKEIPPELETKSISRSVDYSDVVIGDTRFILPVHAEVVLDTGKGNIKNVLRFDSYRKFTAESHLSFSPEPVKSH
jgi:hypothetical protein